MCAAGTGGANRFWDVFKIRDLLFQNMWTAIPNLTTDTTTRGFEKMTSTTMSTSRCGSGHGFRGVSMAIRPDMMGYDRRPMSDRGVSRRVWEATTTVLRGRRGVENTSIHFENGDGRQSLNWAPSAVSQTFHTIGFVSRQSEISTIALLRWIFDLNARESGFYRK